MMRTQKLPHPAPLRVLGLGAYLKNTACLLDRDEVHWSALHGDLATHEACLALDASVRQLLRLADGRVDAVAHDLHPDFESTRVACAVAERLGVPALAVQHHHAHVGVVQAEQGLGDPNGPDAAVIALSLDGVGLGDDGQAWGGELLHVSGPRSQRLGHLSPLALPGGDVAAREPWRMAASLLHALGRGDEIVPRLAPVVGEMLARGVRDMLQRQLNCPMTTSAGRWFDAMAGLLGLSVRQVVEAEAAVVLEQAAAGWLRGRRPPVVPPALVTPALDLRPLASACLDLAATAGVPAAAALFHAGLSAVLAQAAQTAAAQRHVRTVVLSGGCFYNRVLVSLLTRQLEAAGLRVLQPGAHSGPGDAGLALGQAWVGAWQLAEAPSRAALRVSPWERRVATNDTSATAATHRRDIQQEGRACA